MFFTAECVQKHALKDKLDITEDKENAITTTGKVPCIFLLGDFFLLGDSGEGSVPNGPCLCYPYDFEICATTWT